MNILDQIISFKKTEVKERKLAATISELEANALFSRKTLSLKSALLDKQKTGIIAEFKRRSPSKGLINGNSDVTAITQAYTQNGASGLSVLTDEHFFGGSSADLVSARVNQTPILRKDFIIDEYQLVEAKSIGADVILLIAACLTPAEVKRMAAVARSLQLEVLLEIHNEQELGHICDDIDIVGVNNRDLKLFSVDINRSLELSEKIPAGKIKISESGISDIAAIQRLKEAGFSGFLIGENFMKEPDPAIAFASFVNRLKTLSPVKESQ
ncbi:MAG: indole-3-glycerol phosphate synthase TrpC [Flavitalea sp.]